MAKVSDKIIDILKKNMREPPERITPDTPIRELDIESLDLAVIVFDIEDTFGIEIPYNANEEVEDFETVGSIADKVEELISKSRVAA
ncbi:MAG: acyl carrier protein [Methyloligellaceae bacterium]